MMLESRISAGEAFGGACEIARRELAREAGAGAGIFLYGVVEGWGSGFGSEEEPEPEPGRNEGPVESWAGS